MEPRRTLGDNWSGAGACLDAYPVAVPVSRPLLTADRAAEPESILVTMDTGDRLHVLDWGGSTATDLPPLLLVHGLAGTAWTWSPIARRLRGLTRILAPDLRGHGLSEVPRTGYELESQGFDLLTILTAAGFGPDASGRPAVLAGHGFGALAAVAAARASPEAVAGLVLVDAGWEALPEATGMDAAEFLRGLAEPPDVLGSMEAYLADRRDYDPVSWDADQERAARSAVDEKYQGRVVQVVGRLALARDVDAMFAYRPEPLFGEYDGPLLVLVAEAGGADDETARERRLALEDQLAVRAAADLPAPRVVRFRGVGHNLMRYRPDQVSEELAAFLERTRGVGG